ncbi:MAG: PDZ domain-containing protein, partial [Gammaproteobacteria bacterium]
QGIVSALTRDSDSVITRIQTDAAINPGNSGGALINRFGELVGVNSSILSESGNFEGIGFATPVSVAMSAAEEMVAGAIDANSGYLGVITGEALDATSSELFFGVDEVRGMLIESVEEGGAAARAGIRPGDVITRVENSEVTDGENIVMEVRNRKPGDTITVEVYRNGDTYSYPTTLGFGQAIVFDPLSSR